MSQTIRNFAILAHIDAGKTTLSERILFSAGEIRHPGDVEDGLATLDYLPEEKERGITIEAGVAHFEWRDTWFNFIDTPGHIDFGAEVDMALDAVDGAVLVVSAIEGVQTQAQSAWKKLQAKQVRTLLFLNKLDRPEQHLDDVLMEIEEVLGARPVLLSLPYFANGALVGMRDVLSGSLLVHDEHGMDVVAPQPPADPQLERLRREALEAAATVDDGLLEKALDASPVTPGELLAGLAKLAAGHEFVLCYAGSALRNRGVRQLMNGLSFFLPDAPPPPPGQLGHVVRLRHFSGFGEVALFQSAVNLPREQWPAGMEFFRMTAQLLVPVDEIRAQDIYAMRHARHLLELGRRFDLEGKPLPMENGADWHERYTPLLQTRLECLRVEDWHHISRSLDLLARMDPSFRVSLDPAGGCWILATVGEVQLEVLLARLSREFGCEVRASAPDVQWHERLNKNLGPYVNTFQAGPFSVQVELSMYPLATDYAKCTLEGSGLDNLPVETLAAVRSALLEAAEAGVLGKGALHGIGFVIHRLSVGEAPLPMVKKACADAVRLLISPVDVDLYEPYMQLELECPAQYAGNVTGDLQHRDGRIRDVAGDGRMHSLVAEMPLRRAFGYSTQVRSISRGTACYTLRYLEHRMLKS